MNPISPRLGGLSLALLVAAVVTALTTTAVQIVNSARPSIDTLSIKPELGYIKPWSTHPENRAAFRANPTEVA